MQSIKASRWNRLISYEFRTHWDALRHAAAAKGIRILGDLPIFVAMNSADAWAHPELFALDASGHPTEVAGVPPDYFAADGQLYGTGPTDLPGGCRASRRPSVSMTT